MKFLKILLWLILIVVGIGLIIGLMNKGAYSISRSKTIKAPKSVVWANISSFKAGDAWNPWNSLDTTMTKNFPSEDGKVGSKYSWKGNDNVGEGSQTITYMAENDSLAQLLEFTAPWQAKSDIGFKITGEDGNVTLTQTFNGTNDMKDAIIGTIFGAKKMIGDKFEEGLAKLGTICESAPPPATEAAAYKVEELEFPGLILAATMSPKMKFSDLTPKWFGEQYGQVGEYIGKNKLVSKNHAYAVYKNHVEAPEQNADIYVGMDVEKEAAGAGNVTCYPLAKARALRVSYFGDYANMMGAYNAIMKYAADNNLNMDYSIEHYVTDPTTVNGDMSKVQTDVWMVLK